MVSSKGPVLRKSTVNGYASWQNVGGNRIIRFVFILASIIFLLYILAAWQDPNENQRLAHPEILANYNQSLKHILLYTTFDGRADWYLDLPAAEDYFNSIDCPVTNCVMVSNRSYLPSLSNYDALLFTDKLHKREDHPPPNTRRPEQLYVVNVLESPHHTNSYTILENYPNYFNWTMSYRRDADVLAGYGNFLHKDTKKYISPRRGNVWMTPTMERMNVTEIEERINGKSKAAAWFVSNCLSESKRDKLADSMKQHIQVDIYGDCGDFKCPKSSTSCNDMLSKDYFFYLSFENALCEDYLTEKVYKAMQYFVVPVVYNGAENECFLPPHSYIDANKYKSVEELTNYMQYLIANPKEYAKYFWWKDWYYIHRHNYCELCIKLNEPHITDRRQHYSDLGNWFSTDTCWKRSPILNEELDTSRLLEWLRPSNWVKSVRRI